MKNRCLYLLCLLLAGCTPVIEETDFGLYRTVRQKGSPELSYRPESGVTILKVDDHPFKDLNKNGRLDAYEDWRLPSEVRADSLVRMLSIEEIVGLMHYSAQQNPTASELTDDMKAFLGPNHLRHILLAKIPDARTGAEWSNNVQSFCEATPLGIPANNSSDPRNYSKADGEFNAGSGGDISHWPYRFVICKNDSVSVQNTSSGRFNITFPFVQFLCHLCIIIAFDYHEIHQSAKQPQQQYETSHAQE